MGVCKDVDSLSSRLLTLDLKDFDEGPVEAGVSGVASPSMSSAGSRSPAVMAGSGGRSGSGSSEKKAKSDVLGKRKIKEAKLPRRTKQLQTVGEEEAEEKFSLAGEGEEAEGDED